MLSTEVCSLVCDWWEVIIGLTNGLASDSDKLLSKPNMAKFI